jgi:hypothetical protein
MFHTVALSLPMTVISVRPARGVVERRTAESGEPSAAALTWSVLVAIHQRQSIKSAARR